MRLSEHNVGGSNGCGWLCNEGCVFGILGLVLSKVWELGSRLCQRCGELYGYLCGVWDAL